MLGIVKYAGSPAGAPFSAETTEDLLWALLNTPEFVFVD
jgi:hypothetical protein